MGDETDDIIAVGVGVSQIGVDGDVRIVVRIARSDDTGGDSDPRIAHRAVDPDVIIDEDDAVSRNWPGMIRIRSVDRSLIGITGIIATRQTLD